MKRILVPTDFSEGAHNAVLHAIQHASKLGLGIHIIHCYLMPPTGTAVMVDITEMLRKNAEEGLAQVKTDIDKLEVSKTVDIKYSAHHGMVIDVLERITEKGEHPLVAMGTQGASGITEKFLGSNTAAAAKNLKTPLLAIPAEKHFEKIEKIVIATDLKKVKNPELFSLVETIALHHQAAIRFLHVRRTDEAFDHAQSEAYKQQVDAYFKEHNPLFTFIFENDIEDGLSDALEKDGADLLVVVQRERGFFESLFHHSISQKLINEAALPVLVLRD